MPFRKTHSGEKGTRRSRLGCLCAALCLALGLAAEAWAADGQFEIANWIGSVLESNESVPVDSDSQVKKVRYGYDVAFITEGGYGSCTWDFSLNTVIFSEFTFSMGLCNVNLNWRPWVYNLKYDSNGGTWNTQFKTEIATNFHETVRAYDSVVCTKEGYALQNWNTKQNGSGDSIALSQDLTMGVPPISNDTRTVTLYAQWQANSYAVTIAPGEGGSGGCVVGYTCATTQQVYHISMPTRYGHKITGWTSSSSPAPTINGDVLTIPAGAYGDFTMTPMWTVIQCSISVSAFAHGAAKVNPVGSSFAYGTPVTITAEPDEGYAFAYWDSNVEPKRVYGNPYVFSIKNDVLFQANFTSRVCQVTFDPQGGTCSEASRTVVWGDPIGELPVPTKTGRAFVGWFDAQVEGNEITQSTQIKMAKLKAFAHYDEPQMWTITVVATPEGSGTVSSNGQYASGTTIELKAQPNPGYSFEKWADDATAPSTRQIPVTNDATYTACFTGNVYLVYFESGDELIKRRLTHGAPFGELPVPKQIPGMNFNGWYDDDGSGERITEESIVAVTENKYSFYAHWSVPPRSYISFDGNGATNESPMAVQAVRIGETTNLYPNVYGKVGYTFAGWATNLADAAALRIAYTNCQSVSFPQAQPNETNDLYAVWSTNRYTIAFDPGTNGVYGTMAPLTNCAYDTAITIRCGYTNYCSQGLLGWSMTQGATTADYPVKGTSSSTQGNDAIVSNLTAAADESVILYAVWKDVGDLSKAVGLDNAVLESESWNIASGGRGGIAVTQKAEGSYSVRVKVFGPGVIRFAWYWDLDSEGGSDFYVKEGSSPEVIISEEGTGSWATNEVAVTASGDCEVAWVCRFKWPADYNDLRLDDITWTPGVEVNPANPPKYATKAEAEAAAANARVVRPNAEVEEVVSAENYNAMFIVRAVTNVNSTGASDAWTLATDLNPTISSNVQQTVAVATSDLASQLSTGGSVLSVNMLMTAGLYYGIAVANEVQWLSLAWPTNWVLGTGTTQPLSVDRPSGAESFFQLRVETTKNQE